jgi:HAD superfamily hydrolase (TIGR01549 family)
MGQRRAQAAAECITGGQHRITSTDLPQGTIHLNRPSGRPATVPLTPPVRTLFLDAGGVLIFPNWQRVSETLARHGLAVATETLRHAEPAVKFSIDRAARIATTTDAERGGLYMEGELDAAGVAGGTARERALTELYTYHSEHNLWEYVPPDVPLALERLKGLGLQLAIVSNANGVVHRVFERGGLSAYFDLICDSCVEGVEKPDPRFFHIVLERARATAETTLHVGDLYHVDVVGARRAGLRAMLIDPHELYADVDAERVRSLDALVDRLR